MTVTLTLPCPLLKPKGAGRYYTIVIADVDDYDRDNRFSDVVEWIVDYEDGDFDYQTTYRLEEGLLFETREDAQAWLDAMRNSRR